MTTKQVFVGGTGRSGTTILTELLGTHPVIYSIPIETRFIIDPDGIRDLVLNFSQLHDPKRSDVALFRFERLMLNYLTHKKEDPYRGIDLSNLIGRDFYYKKVTDFCNSLRYSSFVAWNLSSYPSLSWKSRDLLRLPIKFLYRLPESAFRLRYEKYGINVTKRFSGQEITRECAKLIDDLFMRKAKDLGKSIWCEKTPANILHIEFLYRLFPDMKFIHMKRDPREVVYSLKRMKWGPDTIEDASLLIKDMLKGITYIQNSKNIPDNQYLEIKLEDLINETEYTLGEISEFLNVENKFSISNLQKSRVGYWKDKLSEKEINTCESILGDLIPQFGYKR